MRSSARAMTLSSAAAALLLVAGSAAAGGGAPLGEEVALALSGPVRTGEHVVVPRLALDNGKTISLDLEAFEVFARDAAVIIFTDKGPQRVLPPSGRYFRGSVVGDLDSLVVLAGGPTVRGLIFTAGEVYAVGPAQNVYTAQEEGLAARVRRIDLGQGRPAGIQPFACGAEELPPKPPESPRVTELGAPVTVEPQFTSTVYTVNLALETDYEFYQLFGSSSGALRFIGDLTAAASAIYLRDVKTVFQIGTVHLYSTSTNPWSGSYSGTNTLLYALGDYWHANYATVPRTTVHMLSGKNLGGGIAWLGVLCDSDFQFQVCDSQGLNCVTHYGGGYGLSSSLSAQFSSTNPALYWDLQCYTHEIGHNFNTPHTHCYSPPVDHCYNTEPGCYSGALCANGTSDPCSGGTLMSYCHLRSGGESNIIFYFGQTGQASQAVTDLMRTYVESKAGCLLPYASAPNVTGVSPPAGSTSGGTAVTVSGTGFEGYATLTIGGVNATSVTVVNSTTITATTGAHSAGSVNVVVQNPDGQSATKTNGYTYGTLPAPTVTSIFPSFGPTAGGALVTIGGTNFASGATVTLGGSTASVGSLNATTITATSSAHAAGIVDVVVTNPDTQSGTLASGYTYRPPAVATKFFPVTPCRLVDTRNSFLDVQQPGGSTPNYPRGTFASGEARSYDLTSSTNCPGLPSAVGAWSLQFFFTTMGKSGLPSFLTAWPYVSSAGIGGQALPASESTMLGYADRWNANFSVIRAGDDAKGSINVYVEHAGDVAIEVNGYFQ